MSDSNLINHVRKHIEYCDQAEKLPMLTASRGQRVNLCGKCYRLEYIFETDTFGLIPKNAWQEGYAKAKDKLAELETISDEMLVAGQDALRRYGGHVRGQDGADRQALAAIFTAMKAAEAA